MAVILFRQTTTVVGKIQPYHCLARLRIGVAHLTGKMIRIDAFAIAFGDVAAHGAGSPADLISQQNLFVYFIRSGFLFKEADKFLSGLKRKPWSI